MWFWVPSRAPFDLRHSAYNTADRQPGLVPNRPGRADFAYQRRISTIPGNSTGGKVAGDVQGGGGMIRHADRTICIRWGWHNSVSAFFRCRWQVKGLGRRLVLASCSSNLARVASISFPAASMRHGRPNAAVATVSKELRDLRRWISISPPRQILGCGAADRTIPRNCSTSTLRGYLRAWPARGKAWRRQP